MTETTPAAGHPAPLVDRSAKPRSVSRLIFLALVMIGASVTFFLFKDKLNNDLMLGVLGVLAVVGIFFLVSTVIGFVTIMPKTTTDPLARAFIDTHPEGTLVTDEKGRVIYANQAYGRITGTTSASDVQSIEAILSRHRDSAEAVYRLTNAMRDGEAGQEEFRMTHALNDSQDTGSGAYWYRLRGRPVSDGDGEGASRLMAWQLADISQERTEQEMVFKELQNAINYLDHAPVGFFSAGRDGGIVYLNATLADWLGIDLTAFAPGKLMLRDLVAGAGMALVDSVQAEPGLNSTAQLDLDLLKSNGQSFPVRLVHRVTATRDGSPGESRTIVISRDDGVSGARDVANAEMRFTRFFNNTPMAIASVDSRGKILRTNGPFLQMFNGLVSRDDMERGALFEKVLREDDRKLFADALGHAADKQGDIAPIDSRRADDEERHFRLYVNAVIEHSEEAPEETAIIYAVETTEQKALEAQMAQTQKMNAVGTLAGGIAHDFNNVLTAILLSADHLLMSLRPADSSFADLIEIKRNANRAAVLVRQLLAFSRKQTMRPTVLSMTDVIGDLRMLVDRLTGTNVKLDLEFGRDLWLVKTDLGQFEQVLINLAVNARDAMPEGGTITVRTRNVEADEVESLNHRGMELGDYVLIEVADQGTGIAPDVLEKIFEPFFTTKDVGKGTGLGLSMVYGIIKQSGGYIYPDSELGKGTTFRIYLPRYVEDEAEKAAAAAEVEAAANRSAAEGEAAPAAKPASDGPEDLTGGSSVVLLVEDEEAVRRGGKRMLEARGYEVHEAGTGVEALEVLAELEGKVDIVVSDVVMPEMDGPTLLTELRKDYPDMKFIFVSGYAEDAFAKNLPADAKFGFLAKPFSLKQLATAVREMLDA
ncbi:PAS domain S-box [Hoeflea phototrophica DFL-43]|uniref:histidine kinase n=1 Tax=Hoeflea phototrophica (strain DSM 17068 / NCIMB 14078 / DFL-43) TaxID=411684 RepID=A9D6F9_HOEPD|nr:PAS domain-containing sensor histidine kinase [Hoeflea phototrophica]EDQ33492.1 PAS domain S-box [Hoeflea phototrophica DFL-43]